jgi:alpha-D-xyloside xylohydrolase
LSKRFDNWFLSMINDANHRSCSQRANSQGPMVLDGALGATFTEEDGALVRRSGEETLRIEAWGRNSARVRVCVAQAGEDVGALVSPPLAHSAVTLGEDGGASLTVGELTVDVNNAGHLSFVRSSDRSELLAEQPIHFWWPGPRNFTSRSNGYYRLEQQFRAYEDERLYGLGQHQHGRLDQKGVVLDLVQRNAEVTIPFVVSNRGYGLLWNNPGTGRVELGKTATRWVADEAESIDYWVTAGTPAEIALQYADATGHAPMLPAWAAGFWQSKLRYRTQDELLAVARRYRELELPLSAIVVDFFHWPHLGDWRFDDSEWPDPAAMIEELAEMNCKLVVSVWPSVSSYSPNYEEMLSRSLFIGVEHGVPFHTEFPDRGSAVPAPVSFYDPTNPAARDFLWQQLNENYRALGAGAFWLDACEPEIRPEQAANLRFHVGPGSAVINRYPLDHARAIYDGMQRTGDEDVISLCRSAWAGSQRYGAAVWSGDIGVTFDALRAQIRAGLNIGLSGIPWWTSDIGGFHGGDPDDPDYRELMIRWFQYGVWCPLFRLHGHREPRTAMDVNISGGPNEVWSYGEEAFGIVSKLLLLRERVMPYILEQMREASELGTPPMRPLWFENPTDQTAWTIEDQFMFGPDVLVAPITELGARSRSVYLPDSCEWRHAFLGETLLGGGWHEVEAPLEWIPVFTREGSALELGELLATAD